MNINPISGNYVIPKGFAFARFGDNDYWEELGDMDAFETSVDVERDERKDNRWGVARTSDSQVTDIGVSVSMTLMQHTNRNRALAVMGSNGIMTQVAAPALEKTITDTVAKPVLFPRPLRRDGCFSDRRSRERNSCLAWTTRWTLSPALFSR